MGEVFVFILRTPKKFLEGEKHMARKLMAILLVVCMAIPMMVFQANAATPSGTATYSVGDNFDADNGGVSM